MNLLIQCLLVCSLATSSARVAEEIDQSNIHSVLRLSSTKAKRVTIIAENGGYFPVVTRMKDGRIAAILRGGGSHIDVRGRLDIVFSSDEGETWSPPQIVVDGPNDDRNPALGVAADGTLVLAYLVAYGYPANKSEAELREMGPANYLRGSGIYIIRSHDHGMTWDAPTMVNIFRGPYPSPYGKILTLDDGSMLMTLYTTDNFFGVPMPRPGAQGQYAYTLRSFDHGKTWGQISLLGAGFDETALLQVRSKEIIAVMRSNPGAAEATTKGALFLTRSSDYAKTWSSPERLTKEREIPADLIELSDGRIILTHGQRNYPMGVQALVSSDGGRTFNLTDRLALAWFANNRDTGYPSSLVRKDGKILTLYYQMDDPMNHPPSAKGLALIWEAPLNWK